MATIFINISANAWTLVRAAETQTKAITITNSGDTFVSIAIGTTLPTLQDGHIIPPKESIAISLIAGDIVYAKSNGAGILAIS